MGVPVAKSGKIQRHFFIKKNLRSFHYRGFYQNSEKLLRNNTKCVAGNHQLFVSGDGHHFHFG